MKNLGIVGFGSFGQFIVPHLKPYFNIYVHDRMDLSDAASKLGVKWGSLKEVVQKDIVVLGVPVQYLEDLVISVKDIINPHALVLDISSVKIKPVDLMMQHLPSSVQIVGTHPLFGPQSGRNGIKGFNMVVSPVRTRLYGNLFRFFSKILELNVLERTPVVHDKQMAYVQALTHFIGRAVNEMDIPDVEQKTQAYQYLLDIKRNLGQDSLDLFLTIEKENPFAKEVRDQFIDELNILNKKLEDPKVLM
ncbi:prephenate dehydrogenase/arogenate dehydrogenase family protein [Cytophagaceae bacterium ABcell3]|nr:prephenate dehydrogenase/arogenate dehydrogenase family protein [Cytophagaceae bacterium ABcell3]